VEIDDLYGGSKRQMKVYIGLSRHEFNLRKDGVLSVGGVLFLTTLSRRQNMMRAAQNSPLLMALPLFSSICPKKCQDSRNETSTSICELII
jgi:hypothetical protein